jgi:endonuclease/exonuclease/phosphatase family metal-dependent hydrolase
MQLRVMTLNVWALLPPLSRDTPARMRAIGAALGPLELDVAAFQECWDPPSREALVAASAESGLSHVWHPDQGLRGSGLVVLSRWPIAAARLHRFELRGVAERVHEADYVGHKGFALLALQTPAGLLHFVNTHLQAAYAERADDPHVASRVGQALQLAERIRNLDGPVILAGDFNFEETHEEHRVLTGVSGVVDVAATLYRREDTIVPGNAYTRGKQRGERIDYLFSRGGGGLQVSPRSISRVLDGPLPGVEGASYSDHAGLLGEFDLQRGAVASPSLDPRALAGVRSLLEDGGEQVLRRQQRERVQGSLALALFPGAVRLSRRPPLSRRRFLRPGVLAVGCLAGGIGLARLASTELLRPDEAAGFDLALARLTSLERS